MKIGRGPTSNIHDARDILIFQVQLSLCKDALVKTKLSTLRVVRTCDRMRRSLRQEKCGNKLCNTRSVEKRAFLKSFSGNDLRRLTTSNVLNGDTVEHRIQE